MCNNNSVSRTPWTICDKCQEVIDSLGRCGCDYQRMPVMGGHRKPGMSNGSKIVAAFAGIVFAASLFVAPAKAQDASQPTPSVGEPPKALHVVYLPTIQVGEAEIVHGCDDCQAVSWRPTGDMKW